MNPPKLYTNKLISFLLITLISLVFNLSHHQNLVDACHPHDEKILLRIKNNLGDPLSLASWRPSNGGCCDPDAETEWEAISCDNAGRVTSIYLYHANDIYTFPPFLDRLPFLREISFIYAPYLTGPIPSYIGNLKNLTTFAILQSKVGMGGPIPSFLGHLTKLQRLDLIASEFTGEIPEFIGELTSLTGLELQRNQLTGNIPSTLAKLTNLDDLKLDSNNLTGPIPDFLGQRLVNLHTITLNTNHLTGKIPKSLTLLPNLQVLVLSSNKLTGSIPKTLGSAPTTSQIRLDHNRLTGDASFLFDKDRTGIVEVDISSNRLKFNLSKVELASHLFVFNISHNEIYGSLPDSFQQFSLYMDNIDVSYNKLCGPIPNGALFEQADPMAFTHNKCLCGGPLPPCK